jgi:DNA-binding MarR family transcriptional regulator
MKKHNESSLDHNLGYILSRTANRLDLIFQRSINEEGYPVTVHQWRILQELYDRDGLSQVELSKLLEKNGPNVTRILDVMGKNELITRSPDSHDRRKYLICLTEKGRDLKEKISPLSGAAREKAFGNISRKDLKKFQEIIGKMYENMD